MPQKILFKVTGDAAIIKAFKTLGDKVSKGVVKPAAKRAAKKFEAAIRANAPERTGKLKRSLKVKTAKGPRSFKGRTVIAFATIIGQGKPNAKQKASGEKIPYYAFMQERGFHSGKRVRQGQKVVGYVPAIGRLGSQGVKYTPGRFFVKKALKANEDSIKTAMLSEIYAGIERIAEEG